MVAVPAVGTVSPSRARMLVVFPDPFGPRNAVMRPGWTSTERSSTAVTAWYRFVREVKEMATGAPCGSVGAGGEHCKPVPAGLGERECQPHRCRGWTTPRPAGPQPCARRPHLLPLQR